MIPVQGTVSFANGGAVLNLQVPQVQNQQPAPQDQASEHPPTAATILEQIQAGTIVVHPSRMPLTTAQISTMVCAQQLALQLPRGVRGEWSEAAWERLKVLLAGAKRQRCALPAPLLPAGPPMLALPAPLLPAGPPAGPPGDGAGSDSDDGAGSDSDDSSDSSDSDDSDKKATDSDNDKKATGSDNDKHATDITEDPQYVVLSEAFDEVQEELQESKQYAHEKEMEIQEQSQRIDTLVGNIQEYERETADFRKYLLQTLSEEEVAKIAKGDF